MTNPLGGFFAKRKSSRSKWLLLFTLGYVWQYQKTLDNGTWKTLPLLKKFIGEGMLVQNLKAIGQASNSGNPLIIENITKMSWPFLYVGNWPREKFCFNLIFFFLYSLQFFLDLFEFCLGFCLSLFIVSFLKGRK